MNRTLIVLLALSLSVGGCATWRTAPGNAAATEHVRLAELAKVADASKRVLLVAEQIQKLEIALHDGKLVPDAAHRTVQQAFLTFAREASAGLRLAADVTKSEADRRHAVGGLIVLADHLVGQLEVVMPPNLGPQLRSGIAALHAALLALQLSI